MCLDTTRFKAGCLLRYGAIVVVALVLGVRVAPSYGQVPIPLQEQIERFNTLPAAQQQALIRELQSVLPPAQRDAILSQLTGRSEDAPQSPNRQDSGEARSTVEPRQEGLSEPQGPPRLRAGDTLVIEFRLPDEPAPDRTPEERLRLEETRERLADGNPYELDSLGRLYLPGIPAIELAGLSPAQATIRIRAERELRSFEVVLTHLPLEPVGTAALQPFGYDLFSGRLQQFSPQADIPVPSDYVIGPGDTVNVQLFGSQNQEYFLTVSREGSINFPQIGPITVSGLTVTDLRATIDQRVAEQMIGVRASTTLGELRSIQVFVLGDVVRPGAHTVSGLATMTTGLYASGGVKRIGSLRNVALIRDGAQVATLDLYDLLLRGDTSNDARLQSGDAIFVPPIGPTVAVGGEVRRPAIYEVTRGSSIADLIQLAGGLSANANPSTLKLERISVGRGKIVRDINLANESDVTVQDGDVIRVQPNLDQLEDSVRLAGNVFQPGLYQWYDGMRLSDLLPSSELIKPLSDLNYVLIRRENEPNINIEVLSADLEAIWRGQRDADLELQPRDTVTVFNLEIGRQHVIGPLMGILRAQAPASQPIARVSIGGQVRAPGQYPLESEMRVADLLRAGGGLTPSAYSIAAELTRYEVVNDEYRETELVNIDLAAVLRGDAAANLLLAPYDHLTIKEVPRWQEQQSVTILGEVQFPGEYPIRQGETLSAVIERAGGLSELAFPAGSVFTRVELREREREQLETLARRVESDLAAVALSDPGATDVIGTGQTLIDQLRNTEAVGRLVIDLEALLAGEENRDVVLRDGDRLVVPPVTQEVMVLGEVQYPTSHLFRSGLSRDSYIDMSGGVTNRADERRIYVVRANGAVITDSGKRWFRRSSNDRMQPGDTIVVPLDTDRVRPLVAWEGITQILYNIAIAVSVIDRL